MASKNNPELRGRKTELRKVDGKDVKPCLYIHIEMGVRFMAAAFENGDLAMGANGLPIPYKSV